MNDISGIFMYQGIHTVQQVSNIKYFFEKLLKKENFDVIIELGTSFGGLTYILDDIIKENDLTHNIHTFDISYKDYVDSQLIDRKCHYHIFDEETDIFISKVSELLRINGKTLLLCDGGDKKYEFSVLSKFLKFGDFIMAHDYSYDRNIFEQRILNKIWNWFEISYEDVIPYLMEYGIEEYKDIDFTDAVWGCFKKTKI